MWHHRIVIYVTLYAVVKSYPRINSHAEFNMNNTNQQLLLAAFGANLLCLLKTVSYFENILNILLVLQVLYVKAQNTCR